MQMSTALRSRSLRRLPRALPSTGGVAFAVLCALAAGCSSLESEAAATAPERGSIETQAPSEEAPSGEAPSGEALVAVAAPVTGATPLTAEAVVSGAAGSPSNASYATRPVPAERRAAMDRAAALSVWKSPAFQRQMANGLASETDIEAPFTADEVEVLLEVNELLGEEELEEAIELLEEEASESATAQFDVALAKLYRSVERDDDALVLFRRAAEKFPSFRRAHREIGVLQVQRGEFVEGRRALVRVLELGGSDGVTYGLLGFCHAQLGDPYAAEGAFRMAMTLDPETADWKNQMARSLLVQRRYADAVALFDSLLIDEPESGAMWLLQANALLGLEDYKRAAQNYEIVDRLQQSTPESLNLLANVYLQEKLYDQAVGANLRALQLGPDAPIEPAAKTVAILAREGEYEAAERLLVGLESLRTLTMDDGEWTQFYEARAILAAKADPGEAQIRALQEILALDPLAGHVMLTLGRVYEEEGDEVQAIHYFERAAALPEFEQKALVSHAGLLSRKGSYPEALALLKQAQQSGYDESIAGSIADLEARVQGR